MRLAIPLLAVALTLAVATGAALLIRACGATLPFTGHVVGLCADETALVIDRRLAALEVERIALRRSIGFLENTLASQQCFAETPVTAFPVPDLPEDGFDSRRFAERDLGVLEGCWSLESDYTLEHSIEGSFSVGEWQMCFGSNGSGQQDLTMSGRQRNLQCAGSVQGRFNANGALEIDDMSDVPCNYNWVISQRVITCTINGGGSSSCVTRHLNGSRGDRVTLRRASTGRP